MAGSRTASVLLVLLAASAFNGCCAEGWKMKDWKIIVGAGGDGGNGGKVVQLAETNQAGIANAAKTMQTANANGGAGGDGVKLGKDGFPDSFILIGKGGKGGDGGKVYQKSVTNQAGAFNSASTTQTGTANGGPGGAGVNGRKLQNWKKCTHKWCHHHHYPKIITLVGVGGNGGNGGKVVQYSQTNQVGFKNKAKTVQTGTANGGNGGAGIKGRRLLNDWDNIFVAFGKGGNGGNGGKIGQFAFTNQKGFFNKAETEQTATANGGDGGAGISG